MNVSITLHMVKCGADQGGAGGVLILQDLMCDSGSALEVAPPEGVIDKYPCLECGAARPPGRWFVRITGTRARINEGFTVP